MKARIFRISLGLLILTIASHIFLGAHYLLPVHGNFLLPRAAAPTPPKIYDIAYVRIYVSDLSQARVFYNVALKSALTFPCQPPCDWCVMPPCSISTSPKSA